ncbi:MAG: hypothetical protein HWE14_11020 [Flavobacteriia bacterium]|nr:hypothetical protein [Flavobacteriia bacterium]
MKRFILSIGVVAAALTFTSCSPEEEPTPSPSGTGTLSLNFEYVWAMGSMPFEMETALYHPMTGDTLTYTTFKHYVSNVKLIADDNSTYNVPESYHLIDLMDENSTNITINDVPAGTYKGIMITFGVDSARNVSGSQTGALDPANEMFWSWNSGYIMLKAEGTSPQSGNGNFIYHLGGFSGNINTVVERSFDFPNGSQITVENNGQLNVTMQANPARLFHTYGSVSNGAMVHMPGPSAVMMTADFNSWIRLTDAQ